MIQEIHPHELHNEFLPGKEAKAGERFQFFRSGYYIADSVLSKEGAPVFNQIVGLKSSWKPIV